ncbi:MAG: SAM-dependent methyltransferase [Solirubrobacterales bacterium]
MTRKMSFVCAVALWMSLIPSAWAATESSQRPDVVFVPTPQNVVDKMLELANVTKDDVLYDLGCGDGRIPVTAAKKYGCKAFGFDIDPNRVRESIANVQKSGVQDLVTIQQKDIFKLDLSPASVVTLYLLPDLNVKLIPQLEKLKPGSRIVSHDFAMKGVTPDQVVTVMGEEKNPRSHKIYLWTTPLKKDETAEVRRPDVIFVPTPPHVVEKMLEVAKVTKNDRVYDLGCGDGRIPVFAAKKYGCKAWGFDVDPKRIQESLENVKANGVDKLVTIQQKDIFKLDLSDANVVTLYLLPGLNAKLVPQLDKLKPGSRIVSHDFDMKGVIPDQIITVKAQDDSSMDHTIYLWTTPLKKEVDVAGRRPDVIYVPTPQQVVDKMLELAGVTQADVVYDLGCGDGRIPVTAAKTYGCKAFGYDLDPQRIRESLENVENSGVGNLVTIEQKDIFTLDLSDANVVTLYLLPSLNVKLIPQLDKLKPGARIVSHDFDMRGVTPDQVVTVSGDGGLTHTIYLWTAPLKKEPESAQ